MRVTNSMLIGNFMHNLNRNLKQMETLQYQLSTGRKFTRASQDPVGITKSLQTRSDLSKVRQYIENTKDAQAWLNTTETALMEMNSLITRVYELTVDASNGSKTPDDRKAIQDEVEQLKKQLVESANSTFSGRYIFGGHNTTSRPFEITQDGALSYNGQNVVELGDEANMDILSNFNRQTINYEVGPNVRMDISIPGTALLGVGEDNIFAVFDRVSQALQNNDQDVLMESIGMLQKKQEEILSHVAEVGGKTNRLDLVEQRLLNDEFNYTAVRSQVEDVDHDKAIMEFKMAEVVYRSALAVGAKIIQPTLLDFLR